MVAQIENEQERTQNSQAEQSPLDSGPAFSQLLDATHCMDNCDGMMLLPRECIDLVVTSPPYDDLRTYGGHSWDFYGVAWNLARVLKPGGVIVWVVGDATKDGSETGSSMEQALFFKRIGLNLHDTMIYQQPGTGAKGSNLAYWQAWEYMYIFSKGKPKTVNRIADKKNIKAGAVCTTGAIQKETGTRQHKEGGTVVGDFGVRDNIWRIPSGNGHNETTGHPAQFPDKLAKDHIYSWGNKGDIVLDPFMGSGTAAKAAQELGRHYIGFEINPEYVEICQRRMAQATLGI